MNTRLSIRFMIPVVIGAATALLQAQQSAAAPRPPSVRVVERILAQDPTFDNLVDPPGLVTAPLGRLGAVVRIGHGPRHMLLVPGLGFSADTFREFMHRHENEWSMLAVTLPGFGGTPPPPCPPAGTSFAQQTWTNAAVDAIERMLIQERLDHLVVVGHWLGGTQVALRLAARRTEDVSAVVLIAGVAGMASNDPRRAKALATLESRAAMVDQYLAPKWFRTVTRETWDDNNFLPSDYAVDPVLGLRLWREAARPALHVWVRYLCEFNAQDVTLELAAPSVPTLLLQPGLEGRPSDPDNDYMSLFCHASWQRWNGTAPRLQVQTIADARACLWIDQPARVDAALTGFLRMQSQPTKAR